LLRENVRAAKRNRTKLATPPVVGAAEVDADFFELGEVKAQDLDADDVSTAAPASPSPSTSTSSSSPLPVDEPDQAPGNGYTIKVSYETAKSKKASDQVLVLPSVFEGRPPVMFFSYTEACGAKQRHMGRAVDICTGTPKVSFIHTKSSEYNAVLNTMRQGGLRRSDEDSHTWSVLWSRHPAPETMCSMTSIQKTNHFPGSWHLGEKGLLWTCIAAMQDKFGSDFSITPIGFVLPEDASSLKAARRQEPDALWIWKPLTGSCGRGIKVFTSTEDSAAQHKLMRKPAIVQRYVPSPLTINGYKFDMRIYVVVVSYDPLQVYIDTEGLVRLATQKYSEDPSTLADRTRHLTNYTINKKSPLFVKNDDSDNIENTQSSKWSLTELQAHFAEIGLDYNDMFEGIKDVVIKTLLAVEPQMREEWTKALNSDGDGWLAHGPGGAHAASCFELYGFDILLDTQLKPWLLEVNIYPSLSSGSPLDKRIKTKLVADMLTLVGLKVPPASRDIHRDVKRAKISHSETDISGDEFRAQHTPLNASASASDLAAKAACLANCKTPLDAVDLFDETAWDLVMDAHDQDMRRGGLQRIYPTSQSSKYVKFMAEESYSNVVLRKFYEAGGADQFWGSAANITQSLPPYVPPKISFQAT